VISGIIDEGVGTAILHDMLSNIVALDSRDTKDYFYVGVVVGFARHYAEDVAGIFPRKHHILWGKYELKPPRVQLLKPEKQSLFRELLIDYYRSASKYLANQHKEMHKRARKDVQILQSKGELSPEREEENEKARKNYEKLVTNLTTLADVLDQDMIDLPEDQSIHETSNISIDLQLPSLSTKVH
jgi:regulator of nonsense transcripts 2